MNNTEILEAIARGYCSEKNQSKTLDVELCLAIAAEIEKLNPEVKTEGMAIPWLPKKYNLQVE